MRQNETNEKPATLNPLSRRSFFGRFGASTAAAAAAGVGLPSFLSSETAKAADDDEESSRKARSYGIRVKAAIAERDQQCRLGPRHGRCALALGRRASSTARRGGHH
jgi:hypothetical protein